MEPSRDIGSYIFCNNGKQMPRWLQVTNEFTLMRGRPTDRRIAIAVAGSVRRGDHHHTADARCKVRPRTLHVLERSIHLLGGHRGRLF